MKLKEDGEVTRIESDEKNGKPEAMTFKEENNLEVPESFNLKIQVVTLFLVWLIM